MTSIKIDIKKVFLPAILFFQLGTAQVNLTSSLTACYGMNGNGMEPINNLTATLSAAITPTLDRFNNAGSALYFNGTTGCYAQLPNDPLLKPTTAISFSFWFKTNVAISQYIVFTKNTVTSNFEAYTFNTSTQFGPCRFRLQKGAFGSTTVVDGTSIVSPGTWYHVVGTIDNNTLNLYVNGVLENSLPTSMPFSYDASGKKVILGGSNELNFNQPFNGSLDNVRFYNRVITAAEANALYNQDPICTAVPSGTIPTVAFSVSSVSICAGGTIQLNDLSSYTPTAWNWQIPGANPPSSTIQNPTINFPNSGTYTVSLVSSNTVGASNTATQSIVVLPNPTLTVLANSSSICIGQNTNLFASGASTFTWSNFQQGPSINVTPIVNTTYSVTGVDNNGCSNTGAVSVAVNPLPTVTASASKSVICRGQNVTFTAGGASTYTWNSQQTSTTIVVSPFVNTSYYVTGTDINGCKNSATVSVVVNECIGLNEKFFQNGFSVFPNPGNGVCEIKFSESKTGALRIFNGLSQLIYDSQFENTEHLNFDLTGQANGIYLLNLNTGSGSVNIKIIKTD